MRKIIYTLIISIAFFLQSNAQYLPLFAIDSTEWNVHAIGVNGVFDSNQNIHYSITKWNNDTLIYSDKEIYYYAPDTVKISVNEDNSKAWIFLENFNKKIMVYDMMLEKTDSFKLFTYTENTIDSTHIYVDTTYVLEGRKIIEFKNFGNFLFDDVFGHDWKFRFVEGVGPLNFFLYGYQSTHIIDYPYMIICKSDNNELHYETFWKTKSYQDCAIALGLLGFNLPIIKTYPNPAKDFIVLQNFQPKSVVAFTIYGKEIPIKFQNNFIDTSNLQKGIYHLLIENSKGEIFYSKIIKQ